jgi:hypothetical protein
LVFENSKTKIEFEVEFNNMNEFGPIITFIPILPCEHLYFKIKLMLVERLIGHIHGWGSKKE